MTAKIAVFSSALVLILAGALIAQAAPDPKDPGQTNVSFKAADGATLNGYLALPQGDGPFPGVVLIHEWWGLNRDTTILADALSREGFAVLAADTFRGKVAREAADAQKQTRETPPAQIAADLDAAFMFLAAHPKVSPSRVASWGFCFGGTQSMRMGARNPGLAAVVIFYGGGPFQKADDLGQMAKAGPVLGVYGEQDAGIPVAQVKNFENAMYERGVRSTVTIYPGVGHAFVKSDTYNKGGAPEQAWKQALAFLKSNLM
jgi:carboxymethylenebutenolidase